ncbi:MAG: CoA pyrophosphatase [Bacteroidetes bacterium]|nr:CoA pyrophosphatase [Bacteroidota bacterium]
MKNSLQQPEIFFEKLQQRFKSPLPGEGAQNRMTSRLRIPTDDYLKQNPSHLKSAVSLCLYPEKGEIFSMLIRRPSYDGTHSGQLALPGGKMDKRDETLLQTALRETEEEVGVRFAKKNILGALTPLYIPVSNFLVQPYIVYAKEKPQWKQNPAEVDDIIEFRLAQIFDETLKSRKKIVIGKNMFIDAPCYLINGQILWGATAMIYSELEVMLS